MLNYINSVLDVSEIEFRCECASFSPEKDGEAGEECCEFNCQESAVLYRTLHSPSDETCIPILLVCCKLFARADGCSICQFGRPYVLELESWEVGKLLPFRCVCMFS